ncbi:hypothetical protein [Gynuella sunshinyii]|uniref:hypothetical protein n=1 Tax=Gynuella sunshinyii TaxID=1445505 RepID=UPI001186FC98|nr:hypothetical protein [Gynuella sunshinyii]
MIVKRPVPNDDNHFKFVTYVHAVYLAKRLDSDESVKRFLQLLIKIEDDILAKVPNDVSAFKAKEHIREVIGRLGEDYKNLSTDDLRTTVKQQKSSYITAQIVAYHLADESDEIMRAFRRYHCTRSMTDFGGLRDQYSEGVDVLDAFFREIGELATLVEDTGKFNPEAKSGLIRVLKELGLEAKNGSSVKKSIGATEVIMTIRKLSQIAGVRIEGLEVRKVFNLASGEFERRVDIVFSKGGRLFNLESKAWDLTPEKISDYLWMSFKWTVTRTKVTDANGNVTRVVLDPEKGKRGQMFIDIASNLKAAVIKTVDADNNVIFQVDQSKIMNFLQFDGRTSQEDIEKVITSLLDTIKRKPGELTALVNAVGDIDLKDLAKGEDGYEVVGDLLEDLLKKSIYNQDGFKSYIDVL